MNAPPRRGWRIEQAFRKSAQDFRDAPAIQVASRTITYGELEDSSSRLAARLLWSGIGSGDVVGLLCEDVMQFALGALAILKTGAAYLSIDLRYDLNRARHILNHAAPKLMIGRKLPSDFAGFEIPWLCDTFEFATHPSLNHLPQDVGGTRNVAYVCYTSGTTGQPMGVLVPHEGVRGLAFHSEFDGLAPGLRVASCSTFAFDAITFEVWGTLLNGASLVEAPRSAMLSPWALAEFFRENRIDCAFLTTSLFNAVATRHPDAFYSLKCLIIGGEAVDAAYVKKVFDSGRPPKRLVNGYGPTETTTFATCHTITREDAEQGEIPIGRPFEGRTALIRTPDGRLASEGDEGELCIGGAAVALGYVNHPVLTEARFLADPNSDAPGAKLYRTGDLARFSTGRVIQYLGRMDEQVKIRGYRVEPAGVAAILRQIEGLSDALVLPCVGAFGTKELVAFVQGDGRASSSELRAKASQQMPDYMVPSTFYWVSEFPVKANGKVDAGALFKICDEASETPLAHVDCVESQSDAEQKLFEIWRRNARTSAFDANTPYDEIGDSMSLIGVLIDVETAFGRPLPASDLKPPITIRSMILSLEQESPPVRARANVFAIAQPWNMQRLPDEICAAAGGGEPWRHLQISPEPATSDLYGAVEVMAEALKRQVLESRRDEPCTLIGHSFGGVLAFETARCLESCGVPVARLIMLDSYICKSRSPLGRLVTGLKRFRLLMQADRRGRSDHFKGLLKRTVGLHKSDHASQIRDLCHEALLKYEPLALKAPALLLRCTLYDDELDRPEYRVHDRLIQPWDELARGGLDVIDLDCTHSQVVKDEAYVSLASRSIAAALAAPF